jgi:N-acetylated-alpha-linked acidic dipeptidase
MIQSVWGCLVISGLALGSPLMDPQIWENMFKSTLDPQQARRWLKDLTSKPHPAGSAGDFETAQYVHQKWESFGIPHVETKTYWPLLNYPKSRSLKLLEPVLFEASLRERRIAGDSYSNHEDAVPTFFGYGASGNVTGQVVYANFGSKQDFEILKQRGIEVRNKIVLVRYGNVFRGLKVRAAELAGAAGVLIYSDPMQDGYCRGPVYGGAWYLRSFASQILTKIIKTAHIVLLQGFKEDLFTILVFTQAIL